MLVMERCHGSIAMTVPSDALAPFFIPESLVMSVFFSIFALQNSNESRGASSSFLFYSPFK